MTSDTNNSWLSGNEEQLDNSPLSLSKPAIDDVDELADELAAQFDNQAYRTWYCGVIYEFGIEKVRYWQQKASGGKYPGKLFGYYVRQARSRTNAASDSTNVADKATDIRQGLDVVYDVPDEVLYGDEATRNKYLGDTMDQTMLNTGTTPVKKPFVNPWKLS